MTNAISWNFPEYNLPQRKKGWYVWAVLIFMILLVYTVITANFLFGLIIIISAIIMLIKHNREIRMVKIEITKKGIQIDDTNYSFKELKKFWLVYEPPEIKNLYIDFKRPFKPTLIIPLTDQNPLHIRKFMKEYLEEDLEKEGESTTEALTRILKF